MIERVTVDGRIGSACYLDERFMPVDEAHAVFRKIVFDDGGQLTLAVPHGPEAQQVSPPPHKLLDPKKRVEWAEARARAAVLLQQRWDESQHPREPAGGPGGGQFTSGGGASSAAADSASALLKEEDVTVDQLLESVPGAKEHVKQARARLEKSKPTNAPLSEGGHKNPDNSWTMERQALHNEMILSIITPEAIAAATPKPGEQPVLHLLGGRGGSGKSWFTGPKGTIPKGPLYLNNDDFKAMLPEFKGWNAPNVHEESSEIGEQAERFARDRGLNVTIDGTMKSEATLRRRAEQFKAAGYRIEGHYMYTSPAKAAQRALERFVRGMERNGQGRFVAPEYSLGSTTNEKSFDNVRPLMDTWEIYDNNVDGREPKFHSRSK